MDLKSGQLLWPAIDSPILTPPPLTRDIECDVVVMGAGVSGAFVTLLLAEAGLNVIAIDRRGVAEGSTPASTALVQYEIDTSLTQLANDIGIANAQAAYRSCRRALDDIVELTRKHHIDADLHWTGSLFLATHAGEEEQFVRESAARQAIGIEVEPLSRRELMDRFDIDRPVALHSLAAMGLDPFKLTHGLLHAAERLGAQVFLGEINSIQPGSTQQIVTTAQGNELRCRHVVIAAGYETPEQLKKIARKCRLKSTYALASEPLEGDEPWPGGVLIWESGNPYFYARQTTDNRVILGGEDEPIVDADRRDALIDAKTRTIVEKFEKLRPGKHIQPEFAWAGTFAETADGLPLIGELPDLPGSHVALGYGGNGITFSILAAQIVRDSVMRRPNPLAEVFRLDR